MMDVIIQDELPANLALPIEGIDIWQVYLPDVALCYSQLVTCLSPEEQARMARFVFDSDRQRFGLSRSLLRHLLSAYLQEDPAHLQFAYAAKGKPALALPGSSSSPLQFNLSHSQDWAVCAVSYDCPVGIDVEAIRHLPQLDGLAHRCLTTQERSTLPPLSSSQAVSQFFTYWTCKEAFLKAIGEGLGFPMTQVEINLSPPSLQVLVPQYPGPWMLYPWCPTEGYKAAVVAAGSCVVQLRQFKGVRGWGGEEIGTMG